MPDDLKRVKMLHRTEFQKRISRILGMTKAQRTKFKNAPKTETIDLIIVSLVERATTAGCTTRLNFLIEQLLGKLPEKFEHSSPDGTMPQVQVYVPENGRAKKDE